MARRSKTKLKSGPDQAPMQRALEQGEGAIHRASESLRDQQNRDLDAQMRIAEKVGQGISSAQATVEKRDKEATEDLRYRQAQDFQKKQAETKNRLAEDRLKLEAKKAGYDYNPTDPEKEKERQAGMQAQQKSVREEIKREGPGESGLSGQGESTAWADQLGLPQASPEQQAEMARARQRREQQMSRPLDPTFVQSPEGKMMQRTKIRQQESALEIQRANALARTRQAQTSFMKARFAGDKESMKKAHEYLQQPSRKLTRAVEDLLNGKSINGESMNFIMQEYKDHPAFQHLKDAKTMEDLDENQQSQVLAFLRNQAALSAIDVIEKTGRPPDPEYFDMSHPVIQSYVQNVGMTNMFVKSTGWGRYSGAKSQDDKNFLVGRTAAGFTLRGMMINAAQSIFGGGQDQQQGGADVNQRAAGPGGPEPSGSPGDSAGPTGDSGPQFPGRRPDLSGPPG